MYNPPSFKESVNILNEYNIVFIYTFSLGTISELSRKSNVPKRLRAANLCTVTDEEMRAGEGEKSLKSEQQSWARPLGF